MSHWSSFPLFLFFVFLCYHFVDFCISTFPSTLSYSSNHNRDNPFNVSHAPNHFSVSSFCNFPRWLHLSLFWILIPFIFSRLHCSLFSPFWNLIRIRFLIFHGFHFVHLSIFSLLLLSTFLTILNSSIPHLPNHFIPLTFITFPVSAFPFFHI